MNVRKSTVNDIDRVLEIFESAKKFMRTNGNPYQWINGYPGRDDVLKDIDLGQSYVLEDENGEILATFCFFVGNDKTYDKIYEGSWLNDEVYGVVHRIAVDSQSKGAGSFCMNWAFSQHPNIKVDTHRVNLPMQNMLLKNGFTKCGIIYIESGDERIAFQRCK